MTQAATRRPNRGTPDALDARSRGQFLRWGGWAGLAGTAAFIVTIAMTFSGLASPDGPDDIIRFLDDVSAAGATSYIYGIAGIVLCLLYIPLAVATYRLLAKSNLAWYGSVSVLIGLAVLFPAYVINLLAPAVLAPLAADLGTAGAGALYADYEVARTVAEACFTVGSILSLGIGPLLWGVEWMRGSRRVIGLTGIVTGVSGMIWFVWLVDNGVVGIVLILNVALSLVFFTAASVALVSAGRRMR